MYCVEYGVGGGGVYHRFSDDNGITWSATEDISASTSPESRNAFALGPGHGVVTKDGTLIIPCWMVLRSENVPLKAHMPSVIATLCSKDNGKTWFLGERIPCGNDVVCPNETAASVLSDGRIYLNIRCETAYRASSIGKNGYNEWSVAALDKRLADPRCFGSLAFCDRPGFPHTIFFINCENKDERKNLVLKASADDTKNWNFRLVIDENRGGYADIAFDPKEEKIYIIYENDFGREVFLAVTDIDFMKKNI